MRTLLIDADSLIYPAAAANEYPVEWTPEVYSCHGDYGLACAAVDDQVREMQEAIVADKVIMALSNYDKPWRKEVLPTYKANRKHTVRPLLLKPLRAYVHEKYETFERQGLEGDDVLGILLTRDNPSGEERIVCSIDKDMQTLPGLHVNWTKDRTEAGWTVRGISEETANRYHMLQTLTGDTVDGYGGCPGIGKVKAAKLLEGLTTVEEMWPVVVAAYEKAGLNEEAALQQARVARICRATDYDFKEKRVKLWNP